MEIHGYSQSDFEAAPVGVTVIARIKRKARKQSCKEYPKC